MEVLSREMPYFIGGIANLSRCGHFVLIVLHFWTNTDQDPEKVDFWKLFDPCAVYPSRMQVLDAFLPGFAIVPMRNDDI